MTLADDLLEQARQLAAMDPTRPKQVNLRRAISSAYYIVFHFLIDASASMIATGTGVPGLKPLLSRCYEHRNMHAASQKFQTPGDSLPPKLTESVGNLIIPMELAEIADTFIKLQKARYDADYKINRTFTKEETLRLIGRAAQVAIDWDTVRQQPVAKVFLVSLLHINNFKA